MDFLNSQLERNKLTQKKVEEYQNLYFLFLQKRRDKNKAILYPKIQNKQHLRVKTTVHEKLYHNFHTDKFRRFETKQKENSLFEPTKESYKVNNLYVSGNEFNIFC